MATVLLKAFVLLLQARISVIFLFYNRSRVALEYISEYLYLKVPFVRDYAFQSLVLKRLSEICPTQRVVVP